MSPALKYAPARLPSSYSVSPQSIASLDSRPHTTWYSRLPTSGVSQNVLTHVVFGGEPSAADWARVGPHTAGWSRPVKRDRTLRRSDVMTPAFVNVRDKLSQQCVHTKSTKHNIFKNHYSVVVNISALVGVTIQRKAKDAGIFCRKL